MILTAILITKISETVEVILEGIPTFGYAAYLAGAEPCPDLRSNENSYLVLCS